MVLDLDNVGQAILEENDATFSRLVTLASERAQAGRFDSAVEWAWMAARFATTNPTRCVRSAALERVFDRIAVDTLPRIPASGANGRRRVLHVLSEAHVVGGLTRLVDRWIQRDARSESSVVVTRQDGVVESLTATAERSGGGAAFLGSERNPLERAGELRALAAGAHIVICHLNPDDHVAALAFSGGYVGPPVAVFNHSDHMFLLAPTRASLVIDYRAVGSQFTTEARGYPEALTHRLPLLVPAHASGQRRDETRTVLGATADTVVALTVARAVKFQDTSIRPTFADLLTTALDQNPPLVVWAVGATSGLEPWQSLARRFPGRVQAVGSVADPQPYFDAADIYLDTYPFSSLTSLLEASARALPVLTYDGHRGMRRVLGVSDFVPERSRPRDINSYQARLAELVGDPDERMARGAEALERYQALAPEEAWLEGLEAVYSRLLRKDAVGHAIGDTLPPASNGRLMHHNLAVLAMEVQTPLISYIFGGLPRFDARDRAEARARILVTRVAQKAARILKRDPRRFDVWLLPLASRVTSHVGGG